MPELPEVETVRRTLAPEIVGRSIRNLHIRSRDLVAYPDPEIWARELIGARFHGIGRRGKYLLLAVGTEALPDALLIVHLRMTGRLVLADAAAPELPHTHAVFDLEQGRQLRYSDVRRFGRWSLVSGGDVPGELRQVVISDWSGGPALRDGHPGIPETLRSIGPEPLSAAFSVKALSECLRGRKAPIKSLLLDQRVVAGLGNIYADESLFRAGLHPQRPGGTLREGEIRRLVRAIREVLAQAIDAGGTTFSDYVDGRGVPGEMRSRLAVYGRTGEPCRRCGGSVRKTRLSGRSTHYCPACQPLQVSRSTEVGT